MAGVGADVGGGVGRGGSRAAEDTTGLAEAALCNSVNGPAIGLLSSRRRRSSREKTSLSSSKSRGSSSMGPSSETLGGLRKMLSRSATDSPDNANKARCPETLFMKEGGAHCASVRMLPTFSKFGLSLGALPPLQVSRARNSRAAFPTTPKRSATSEPSGGLGTDTEAPPDAVARTRRKRPTCCRKALSTVTAPLRCRRSRSSSFNFAHAAQTRTKYSMSMSLKLTLVPNTLTMRRAAAARSGQCAPATAASTSRGRSTEETGAAPRLRPPRPPTAPGAAAEYDDEACSAAAAGREGLSKSGPYIKDASSWAR
mmetsp:Transcript_177787/g.570097  ORF Transcript_177787/g.570097 Transcript_177787/m.570097 type:complete len:313 (-) Transcript_177787:1160-2098(-)